MNTNEAVALGAETMEELEAMAKRGRKLAKTIRDVVDTVHKNGPPEGYAGPGWVGALENAALGMEIEAIARGYEAALYAFHSKTTLRCQELGIDLPQRDGGR